MMTEGTPLPIVIQALRAMLDTIGSPVVYMHPSDRAPAAVAVVDPEWLARVWEAATGSGGYADPSLTDAGREAKYMPHEHAEPEDWEASQP